MVSPAIPTSPPSSPPSPPSPIGLAGSPLPPIVVDPGATAPAGLPSLAALDSPVVPDPGLVFATQRDAEIGFAHPSSRDFGE